MKDQNCNSMDEAYPSLPTEEKLRLALRFMKVDPDFYHLNKEIISKNVSLQQAIIAFEKMGIEKEELETRWPILVENKNKLLEAIIALKDMKVPLTADMWGYLIEHELVPEIILTLQKMGITYKKQTFSLSTLLSQNPQTTLKALIWMKERGVRVNTVKHCSEVFYVDKAFILALKDMNIQNFSAKWEEFPLSKTLINCVLILKDRGLQDIEPFWEKLTNTYLANAVVILNKWGLLDIPQQQHELLTNKKLTKSIAILNSYTIPQPHPNLWKTLTENSSLQTFIRALFKKIIANETPASKIIFYAPLFSESTFQAALLTLIDLQVKNLDTICYALIEQYKNPSTFSFQRIQPFLDAIIAVNAFNESMIEEKRVLFIENSKLQDALTALESLKSNQIDGLYKALIHNSKLQEAILFLKETEANNLEEKLNVFNKDPHLLDVIFTVKESLDLDKEVSLNMLASKASTLNQFDSLSNTPTVESLYPKFADQVPTPLVENTLKQTFISKSSIPAEFTELRDKAYNPNSSANTFFSASRSPETQTKSPTDKANSFDSFLERKSNEPYSNDQENQTQREVNSNINFTQHPVPNPSETEELNQPLDTNKKPLKKTVLKKSTSAYFAFKALSFFAGAGGTLSIVAYLATFTVPPLFIGLGLIGLSFLFNKLSNSKCGEPKKTEIAESVNELNPAFNR